MKTTTVAMIAMIGLLIFAGMVEAKSALKRMRTDAIMNKRSMAPAQPMAHGSMVSAVAKKAAEMSKASEVSNNHGLAVSSVATKKSMSRLEYQAAQVKKAAEKVDSATAKKFPPKKVTAKGKK